MKERHVVAPFSRSTNFGKVGRTEGDPEIFLSTIRGKSKLHDARRVDSDEDSPRLMDFPTDVFVSTVISRPPSIRGKVPHVNDRNCGNV